MIIGYSYPKLYAIVFVLQLGFLVPVHTAWRQGFFLLGHGGASLFVRFSTGCVRFWRLLPPEDPPSEGSRGRGWRELVPVDGDGGGCDVRWRSGARVALKACSPPSFEVDSTKH